MIKNFIHIVITITVFLSSSGIWVNSHFCKNEHLKTSFFFSFGSCCEAVESSPCSASDDTCNMVGGHEEEKDDCCENKPDFYKIDQDQELQLVEFKPIKVSTSLVAIIPIINFDLPSLSTNRLHYKKYSPPLIVYDRIVRLQSFLC